MPSPKMSLLPKTLGELTVAWRRYGVVFTQVLRLSVLGSVFRQVNVGTLKAPSAETNSRLPTSVGEAMKCSFDGTAQRTLGDFGPGMPSVWPVRWTLPR